MSNDTTQLATMIKDILHDRLENSTQAHLAFETASLRAFIFATLNSLDHIKQHVERNEITNKAQMTAALQHLINRLENNVANLEDVRMELQRTDTQE